MNISSRIKKLHSKHRKLRHQQQQTGQKIRPNLVFFTGAGISKESGIATFRDKDGLWQDNNNLKYAFMESFKSNLVGFLDFYNKRRTSILAATSSEAHQMIAALERDFNVTVVTQNIDDLHERAGSSRVIHLHGSILHIRPHGFTTKRYFLPWQENIEPGIRHSLTNSQLRPNVVLFGEQIQHYNEAKRVLATADIVALVGTSLTVEPAASLLKCIYPLAKIFNINPDSYSESATMLNIEHLRMTASDELVCLQKKFNN